MENHTSRQASAPNRLLATAFEVEPTPHSPTASFANPAILNYSSCITGWFPCRGGPSVCSAPFSSLPRPKAANPQFRVDYASFTVWLDGQEQAVFKFRYNAQRDAGSFPRSSTFRLDPAVPYECQPSSTNSFKTDAPGALTYERGHQVPANHLDYSELAIKQSNFMTNILPQGKTLKTTDPFT